jgi:hypothetical protein
MTHLADRCVRCRAEAIGPLCPLCTTVLEQVLADHHALAALRATELAASRPARPRPRRRRARLYAVPLYVAPRTTFQVLGTAGAGVWKAGAGAR